MRSIFWGFVLALGLLAGCATWSQPSAEQEASPETNWGSHLRMPTEKGQQLGLDERSRAIEANLGIR